MTPAANLSRRDPCKSPTYAKRQSGVHKKGHMTAGRSVVTLEILTHRAYALSSYALTCAALRQTLHAASVCPDTRLPGLPGLLALLALMALLDGSHKKTQFINNIVVIISGNGCSPLSCRPPAARLPQRARSRTRRLGRGGAGQRDPLEGAAGQQAGSISPLIQKTLV